MILPAAAGSSSTNWSSFVQSRQSFVQSALRGSILHPVTVHGVDRFWRERLNDLCLKKPQAVFELVVEQGRRFRAAARGYALGSGNSIPDYVPVDGFLAMIDAAKKIRMDETGP